MKCMLLLALVAAPFAAAFSADQVTAAFNLWSRQYSKSYATAEERTATPSTGPVLGRFLFWAGFNASAYNWFDALDVRVNTSFTTAAPLAGLKNATVQVRALRNWGPLC